MTDEQIRQNAAAYADSMKDIDGELGWCATRDDFIAGAHSRDEEIKELQRKNVEYFQGIEYWKKRANRLSIRRTKQGKQICRDAEKDPPKDIEPVIGIDKFGNVHQYVYSPEEKIWSMGIFLTDAPDYWMPMPKIKKGE